MPDFIEISTADEFRAIEENLSGKYRLVNDLDLATAFPGRANYWIPGTFDGELDGGGHTISNIQVVMEPQLDNIAIFEAFGPNAIVHNLSFDAPVIDARAGDPAQSGSNQMNVCGLVVTSRARAIFNCHIKNMVAKFNENRGVYNRAMGIANTANTGNGAQGGIRMCSVTNLQVEAARAVSVMGLVMNPQVKVRDCLVRTVQRTAGEASLNAVELYFQLPLQMQNCYLAATDGLIAAGSGTRLQSCYYDADLGRSGDVLKARTTAEMKQEATFVSWDFESVWSMDEGNDYPHLRGENAYVDPRLTAEEYDVLQLARTGYDAKALKAREYDLYGKIFLA